MEKVYLVNVLCSDGATYSVEETVGIATSKEHLEELINLAQQKNPNEQVVYESVNLNEYFGV